MRINWKNTYKNKSKYWVKGNLHTHTSMSPCGRVLPERVVELYEKSGFDFIALTDHWLISNPFDYNSKLIILAGVEANKLHGRHHKCVINTGSNKIVYNKKLSHQKLIDANIRKGAVVTLNHPDWEKREHYGIDELAAYENYTGIEIYNSVIERLDGSPLSTAKWDRLLSMGRKVLGFASQDFHIESDLSESSIIVNVKRKTAKDIIASINTGNFYCCLGVTLTEIKRIKDTIKIKTKNAGLIRFIGFGGTTLKKVYGRSASITFDKKDPRYQYIRVECLGTAGRISWTQPFFR